MTDVKFRKPLVGAFIDITLYDTDESVALPVLEEAYEEALRLQKIFSFFDKESELSKLNRERSIKASDELLDVISKAIVYSQLTAGAYDVTIGKQIKERKAGKPIPQVDCSYMDIKIEGSEVTLTHPDALIDLGSIAKGYIVDKIVDFLKEKGVESGFIDARGDMRIFGERAETIRIQHPRKKDESLLPFKLDNMAVATSGDYNQFYGDYEHSHIINKKDLISVTVIAEDLVTADVLATAIFVSDPYKIKSLLDNNKEVKASTIDRDLNIKNYNGFEGIVEK